MYSNDRHHAQYFKSLRDFSIILVFSAQDDIKFDVITPTPVCAGFSVSFEVKASDPDAGEHVTLDIYF